MEKLIALKCKLVLLTLILVYEVVTSHATQISGNGRCVMQI